MQASSLQLPSPAKINLFLRILDKRTDGFHNLETLMTPLALGDTVILEERPSGFTIECDAPGVPTDESNLVIKAAKRLAEKFGLNTGIHIRLEKKIPVGGGMGGGSSNAAATLRGLNKLWNLNVPQAVLHELAAQLGSDVPFFLYDSPSICRGRGEIVEPIRLGVELGVLLINPGFGIPTKWAYDALAAECSAAKTDVVGKVKGVKKAGAERTLKIEELLVALRNRDAMGIQRGLINSLESPCLRKYPLLTLLTDAMKRHGALGAMMSGSGSTVFGLVETEKDTEALGEKMREEFGTALWMCATKTVDAKD